MTVTMSRSQIILWTLLSYIIMAGNFEEITITAMEGHHVTLPCNIESDDEALQSDLWLLYWNKNTTENPVAYLNFISNDTVYADPRYHVDQGGTSLIISNTTKTDAGIYHCEVDMSTERGLVLSQYIKLSVTEKNSSDLPSVPTTEGGGSMTHLWYLAFIVLVVLIVIGVIYFIRRRNRNGRTKLLNQSLPNPAQLDTDCSERESMINHQGDGNTCSNQLNQSLPNPAQLDTDCSERESMINHQGDGNTCSNQRPSQANPAQQAIDRNGNEVTISQTDFLPHAGILDICLRFLSMMIIFGTSPENKESLENIMGTLSAHLQKTRDQDTQASQQVDVAKGGCDLSHSRILDHCLDFTVMMSTFHLTKQHAEIYYIMDFLHHLLQVWQGTSSSNTSGPQQSSETAVSWDSFTERRHRPTRSSTLSKANIEKECSDLLKMLENLQSTNEPLYAESYRSIVKCLRSQLAHWQAVCRTHSKKHVPQESLQIAAIRGSSFESKSTDEKLLRQLLRRSFDFILMMIRLHEMRGIPEYAKDFNTIVEILHPLVQYLLAASHPDISVPQNRNELPEIDEVPDATDRDQGENETTFVISRDEVPRIKEIDLEHPAN